MSARRFAALAAALAAAILSGAPDAHAFRMIRNLSSGRVTGGNEVTCNSLLGFAHWRDASTAWAHNRALQGVDKRTALVAAMAAWRGVPGAAHRPNLVANTTAGFVTDGQNTIVWANGNGCVGNCLALTALVLEPGQVIVESDITFNDAHEWALGPQADPDTQTVATHELGHALGIHHSEVTGATDDTMPTMHAFDFGTEGSTLEPDDQAALQCSQQRYPPNPVLALGVPADPVEALPGDSLSVPVTLFRGPGFQSAVTLSLLSVPTGVTATVAMPSPFGTTATLTLALAPSTAIGTQPIVLQASGGGESATAVLELTVRRLKVTVEDGAFLVLAGEPAVVSNVTIRRAAGFTEPVTLSLEGLPPASQQVSVQLGQTQIPGTTTTTTLRVSAGRFAPGGTYLPSLKATAASASDSQPFGIEVIPDGGQP